MNRITQMFRTFSKKGRKALIGYLTAGDPDPDESERRVGEALASGLDILELGVPFSDPTADGPAIQVASQRALASGMNLGRVLELVRRLRRDWEVPIVLFGYANPFFRYGYQRIAREAAAAGVDAMLVVDLAFEESHELRRTLRREGLFLIPLIAPTTPRNRAATILARSDGFVYYIMVTGVTGARENLAQDLAEHVRELRTITRLPIAVGFGIKDGRQAAEAARVADAVVVGSALVAAASEGRIRQLVGELRRGLDGGTDN
ncbi:MAG: tryptophan synthase subunit alpha [Kiritimatiellia bacterium]